MTIPYRHVTTQSITVGAASVATTNAFGAGVTLIRVASTTACHIVIAGAPVATAADALLPASWVEYLIVNPGEKLAAIQQAAGGQLRVTEISR